MKVTCLTIEVRNLAMRAADAAKNTSTLIEDTINRVKGSSEAVIKTNETFGKVVNSSEKVSDLVGEIAAASTEQAQGIEQINTAINQMDRVVQNSAATAVESASASEELSAQAESMRGVVIDLKKLVNGNNDTHTVATSHTRNARTAYWRGLRTATASEEASKADNPESRPDKAIPMDNDFKEF